MPGKELKRGDKCPSCSAELRPAVVPTDEQRRGAEDREKRQVLPFGADSASAEQRRDLGELYLCDRCGYKARFPLKDADAADGGAESGTGELAGSGASGRERGSRRT
jgi:hypothetical protein